MKIMYRKLMHTACGQSLALGRLNAHLFAFNDFLNRFANTDEFTEENVRWFVNRIKKETKSAIRDNNEIIDIAEELRS